MDIRNSFIYKKMLEEDRFIEAKLVHKAFVLFAFVYIGFGMADLYYAPERIAEFIIIRLGYCVVPISIFFSAEKFKNFRQTEYVAATHALVASAIITYMIFSTSGGQSPYYAGLNLVAIIALCFFTFTRTFFWITCALIYLPYFACALYVGDFSQIETGLILNSFFIFGTAVTSAGIHHFKEYYRRETVISRIKLQREIENRNEIIEQKTEEAVNLSVLSAQFSPQIVESIKCGRINLDTGGQRLPICAIFVDIVNSTERVIRIDKDKVEKVLSRFLDDSIRIMLKYDITIDKFLGDGLLGFCNAPLKRIDYVSRVLNAALEIREKIEMESDFYEQYWQKKFEIRCGIAMGFANVGFYGSKKYFRSYTAIGPVVNLASRLCSSAMPNQILVPSDIFEAIQNSFELNFSGKKSLKGFDDEVIHTYELLSSKQSAHFNPSLSECPACGSILSLETTTQGHFVFMCKSCCSIIENNMPKKKNINHAS